MVREQKKMLLLFLTWRTVKHVGERLDVLKEGCRATPLLLLLLPLPFLLLLCSIFTTSSADDQDLVAANSLEVKRRELQGCPIILAQLAVINH